MALEVAHRAFEPSSLPFQVVNPALISGRPFVNFLSEFVVLLQTSIVQLTAPLVGNTVPLGLPLSFCLFDNLEVLLKLFDVAALCISFLGYGVDTIGIPC